MSATIRATTTTVDDLIDRIKEAIASGELLPGQRLVEASLLERYGVGRTAIRVALARLEQDGLVVKEPNKGVSVRVVTEEEAVEITKIRRALEAVAAAEAAERATAQDVAALRALLDEMAGDLARGDLFRYSTRNAHLHDAILEIAGSAILTRMVGSLKAQSVKFQFRTVLAPGRSVDSFTEHTALVEAVAAHDPARAAAAAQHHLGQILQALHQTR